MKYPEEVNPLRQKADRWLPGAGLGRKRGGTMQHEAGDKYFLKLTEVVTVAQL